MIIRRRDVKAKKKKLLLPFSNESLDVVDETDVTDTRDDSHDKLVVKGQSYADVSDVTPVVAQVTAKQTSFDSSDIDSDIDEGSGTTLRAGHLVTKGQAYDAVAPVVVNVAAPVTQVDYTGVPVAQGGYTADPVDGQISAPNCVSQDSAKPDCDKESRFKPNKNYGNVGKRKKNKNLDKQSYTQANHKWKILPQLLTLILNRNQGIEAEQKLKTLADRCVCLFQMTIENNNITADQ